MRDARARGARRAESRSWESWNRCAPYDPMRRGPGDGRECRERDGESRGFLDFQRFRSIDSKCEVTLSVGIPMWFLAKYFLTNKSKDKTDAARRDADRPRRRTPPH